MFFPAGLKPTARAHDEMFHVEHWLWKGTARPRIFRRHSHFGSPAVKCRVLTAWLSGSLQTRGSQARSDGTIATARFFALESNLPFAESPCGERWSVAKRAPDLPDHVRKGRSACRANNHLLPSRIEGFCGVWGPRWRAGDLQNPDQSCSWFLEIKRESMDVNLWKISLRQRESFVATAQVAFAFGCIPCFQKALYSFFLGAWRALCCSAEMSAKSLSSG